VLNLSDAAWVLVVDGLEQAARVVTLGAHHRVNEPRVPDHGHRIGRADPIQAFANHGQQRGVVHCALGVHPLQAALRVFDPVAMPAGREAVHPAFIACAQLPRLAAQFQRYAARSVSRRPSRSVSP
jgi:hypothetical protein